MLHVGENFENGLCACQCHHPCVAKQVRGKQDQFLPAGLALINLIKRKNPKRCAVPKMEYCWKMQFQEVDD